jgi:hypothetical protein
MDGAALWRVCFVVLSHRRAHDNWALRDCEERPRAREHEAHIQGARNNGAETDMAGVEGGDV